MHSLSRKLFKIYQTTTNFVPVPILNRFAKQINFQCLSKFSTNDQNKVINEISAGDKDTEHKLKVLMLEVELLRQEGHLVPEDHEMESRHYVELLRLNSRAGRRKYLEFLFKNCRKRENRQRKKEENAARLEGHRANRTPKDIPLEEFVHTYNLLHNTIFLRFRDQTINNVYNNRLIQAMQFGEKLILDCGYYDKMTPRENSNCAKQLMLLFGENRIHDDPFDLHFCNFNKQSSIGENLARRIGTLYEPEFPLNVHEKSYTELFPKEKLIYLTPHCKEEMKSYDYDSIYIVGAIVDKVNQEPLSLAKAKEENIRMMKFPLDKHLLWSGGSGKSLTLNQVVSILLDIKKTGNWEYALRHVPTRKLVKMDEMEQVKTQLKRKKERWTPAVNLNRLSYNQQDNSRRRPVIRSLFDE